MSKPPSSLPTRRHSTLQPKRRQSGIVLVISLIMLVIISLLVVFNMRAATSTESIANNTRITGLGSQAAEIALRYCETATVQIASGTVTMASVPAILDYSASPAWSNMTNWDTTRAGVFVLPLTAVNQAGLGSTYQRAPECVVERLPMANADNTTNTTAAYTITARGFGPEVIAGTARPEGGEVWLQSTIELVTP